jgi:hypothetical protein
VDVNDSSTSSDDDDDAMSQCSAVSKRSFSQRHSDESDGEAEESDKQSTNTATLARARSVSTARSAARASAVRAAGMPAPARLTGRPDATTEGASAAKRAKVTRANTRSVNGASGSSLSNDQ